MERREEEEGKRKQERGRG
jgi:hypothetical protein